MKPVQSADVDGVVFPATIVLPSVIVRTVAGVQAAAYAGGVAADGAVGQRGRAE